MALSGHIDGRHYNRGYNFNNIESQRVQKILLKVFLHYVHRDESECKVNSCQSRYSQLKL